MDNHNYNFDKRFESIGGFGAVASLVADKATGLEKLDEFKNENRDWTFGHLSYDLKNEIEDLT